MPKPLDQYTPNDDLSYKTDSALWKDFREGEAYAFDEVYRLHVDALYNYGMNFVKDSELIKEVIQSLFVKLLSR